MIIYKRLQVQGYMIKNDLKAQTIEVNLNFISM